MRISSQNASPQPRLPQRERGRARVAALLAAAGAVFAERGYDATTMTEIAAHAGASIGSLYQFFPTKALLADALIGHYTDALQERLGRIEAEAGTLETDALGSRLFPLLIEFRADHPAFAVLAEAPEAQQRGGSIRAGLRQQLQVILKRQAPALSDERLATLAVVVLQILKAAVALNAETGLPARAAALDDLAGLLRRYLTTQLGVAGTVPAEL